MKSRIRSLAILTVCLAAFGCKGPEETPKLSPEARRTIVTWMECEECTDGEFAAVVKLGKVAVPTLITNLKNGPAPDGLEPVRQRLAAKYKALAESASTHPEAKIPMSEEDYVKTHLDDYIALYRIRSAEALAEIGGLEAKKALEEVLSANNRGDVKRAVKKSLGRLTSQ